MSSTGAPSLSVGQIKLFWTTKIRVAAVRSMIVSLFKDGKSVSSCTNSKKSSQFVIKHIKLPKQVLICHDLDAIGR